MTTPETSASRIKDEQLRAWLVEYGSAKAATEVHPEIEAELRLREAERADRRKSAKRVTLAQMMEAVIRGGGEVEVGDDGVVTVTPSARLIFTDPAPAATPATRPVHPAPAARAREARPRRSARSHGPPSGDDGSSSDSDPPRPGVDPAALDLEIAAIAADVRRFTRPLAEVERIVGRRVAAALVLANDRDTCSSIVAGRRVLARNLDHVGLRHALRGGPLPDAHAYIEITDAQLDALAEAMPLRRKETTTTRRRRR